MKKLFLIFAVIFSNIFAMEQNNNLLYSKPPIGFSPKEKEKIKAVKVVLEIF